MESTAVVPPLEHHNERNAESKEFPEDEAVNVGFRQELALF